MKTFACTPAHPPGGLYTLLTSRWHRAFRRADQVGAPFRHRMSFFKVFVRFVFGINTGSPKSTLFHRFWVPFRCLFASFWVKTIKNLLQNCAPHFADVFSAILLVCGASKPPKWCFSLRKTMILKKQSFPEFSRKSALLAPFSIPKPVRKPPKRRLEIYLKIDAILELNFRPQVRFPLILGSRPEPQKTKNLRGGRPTRLPFPSFKTKRARSSAKMIPQATLEAFWEHFG